MVRCSRKPAGRRIPFAPARGTSGGTAIIFAKVASKRKPVKGLAAAGRGVTGIGASGCHGTEPGMHYYFELDSGNRILRCALEGRVTDTEVREVYRLIS